MSDAPLDRASMRRLAYQGCVVLAPGVVAAAVALRPLSCLRIAYVETT